MLRYFAGENFDPVIAEGLRRVGIDVLTVVEAGRRGKSDSDHIRYCIGEKRVVVTHDVDYQMIHRAGTTHAGIVWVRSGKYGIGESIELLEILSAMYDLDEFTNRLEYL